MSDERLRAMLDRVVAYPAGDHWSGDTALAMASEFDPCQQGNFDALVQAWLPLTYAVNSLNQSMAQPDLYPFFWRRPSWASCASCTA